MKTQADLDSKLAELSAAVAELPARVAAAIAAATPPAVDFSPEVATVQAAVDGVNAVAPAPVAP